LVQEIGAEKLVPQVRPRSGLTWALDDAEGPG